MRPALLIGTLMLVLAGCGNSDSLSHKQLLAQSSRACTNWHKQQAALADPDSGSDVERYMRDQAGQIDKLTDNLSKLSPGDGDRPQLEALLASLTAASDLFNKMGDAAKAQNSPQMEAISSRFDKAGAAIDKAAKDLGAPACGGGG